MSRNGKYKGWLLFQDQLIVSLRLGHFFSRFQAGIFTNYFKM